MAKYVICFVCPLVPDGDFFPSGEVICEKINIVRGTARSLSLDNLLFLKRRKFTWKLLCGESLTKDLYLSFDFF
jgi:hypothetical protein